MFDTFCSLHNSRIAIFFVLERYVVHDNDHEIADLNLQLFDFLFNIRCFLKYYLINRLQPSATEFNEPRTIE